MNTVFIPVRVDRLPTQYEIQRAICNRLEATQPQKKVIIPHLVIPKMKRSRVTDHVFFRLLA